MDMSTHEPVRTHAPVIFFSSVSGNTARYVAKAQTRSGFEASRLPLRRADAPVAAQAPYVLVVPTYGGGCGPGAVPKQVIQFLNVPANRELLAGVISCGNTNFGQAYCLAGAIIADKCKVPHLHRTEIFGTDEDVTALCQAVQSLAARAPHTLVDAGPRRD